MFAFTLALAVASSVPAQSDERRVGGQRPLSRLQLEQGLGYLSHIPSQAAEDRGIAVRVIPPPRPRYANGAPVVVHVPGGVSAGSVAGRPELAKFGFVEIYFAFPGGGRGTTKSGGTYDFYGPTDWHIIFPDWTSDPDDPESYDFRSSDVRIRAIVENGFRCFYRLGTSWKGRQKRPINDPPGTIRGPDGKIIHRADRNDFRKWAKICAKTVLHYTKGWKNGFHYPIEYWEVWNEPDLAAQFWTGTPEQYYMMYEETAKAIKEMNPKLKVGGPACTGGLREAYVERLIQYCHDNDVPLDFFSWHSYGGRGNFNPYQHYVDAMRIRKTLDKYGFDKTENINTEWNAGIQRRLFSDTPAGAAFYASALANFLDAGVDHTFQYCGDRHPGLGLHDFSTGKPKISAYSFLAWKRLLDAPKRVMAGGSDKFGYNIVAGKDATSRHVRILISNFQSSYKAFRLRIVNLPWEKAARFKMSRWLLDAEHRQFNTVEEMVGNGRELTIERPFGSESVCLIELDSMLPLGESNQGSIAETNTHRPQTLTSDRKVTREEFLGL